VGYDKLLFHARCAVDHMYSLFSSDLSKIALVLYPLGRYCYVSRTAPVRLASWRTHCWYDDFPSVPSYLKI